MKGQLQELGEETDENVENISKMQGQILNLTNGKVNIFDGAGEFRSTYEIMKDISEVWDDLNSIAQADLLETIAGKHRANSVAALLSNWQNVEAAVKSASEAEGSAARENAKYVDSIQGRLDKMTTSWQSFANTFMSSDFLKGAISALTGFIEGLEKVIETVGTFPTLITTIATGMSIFKNKGFFSVLNKDVTGAQKQLALLGKSFKDISRDMASGQGLFTSLFSKSITKADVGYITDFMNQIKSGVPTGKAWANTMTNASVAGKKMAVGVKQGTVELSSLKTATLGGKAALFGLEAAATAANIALTMGLSFAIQLVVEGIMKLVNAKKDLAESVEEITSKFKEQSSELEKLKGDYDTTNESSMISKYEKLSKGVDGLGKNVSLTADEYSEYQSIVNTIAEQIPSLVSGYDSQGNALLSCKGNVEELTDAYEKLIHAQNQDILTNTGNIEKDFENTLKDAEKGSFLGMGKKVSTPSIELLEKTLNGNYSVEEIKSLLKDLDAGQKDGVYEALYNAGIGDMGRVYTTTEVAETLAKQLKTDKSKIKGIIDDYYGQFADAVEEQKTIAQAKLSEAFDVGSAISGLNYGNISEELQAIAYQTVNSLDFDFFSKLSENGKTVEQWTTEMLNQLNAIGKADNAKIEAAFDLQTQFNGGDISYGEYVKNLQDVESVIDGLNLKSEAKEQLKIVLGLDENGVIDDYNDLINRLTDSKNYDFNISETEARKLLDGLSSEELKVAVGVITDMSNNNYSETAEEIRTAIERELTKQGLSLDLTIEKAKVNFEALSTAIAESFSGSGLSEESISAVEGMFSGLSSYDKSKLFERTANGISLNSTELRRLNSESKQINIAQINKEMDSLGDIYNQTREELYRLTYGTDEYNDKASDLSAIEQQIKDLEKLAAGYEGVASAFQEWQMMESAGSQRDMYESIIEGFENIDDEISRGWYDDGTIEFLELLSGKDLSTAGIEEVKKAYSGLKKEIKNTGYTVRDFFTTDEDGNSTNTGVYNFLKAIDKLEKSEFGGKDVVKRNENDKNKIIGFDFQVVGGDEVIAETLGISEELVQIMVRAADDAGFVVTLDGSFEQLDILKEKAQEASESLNRILEKNGKKGFDFNFNTSDVKDITKQLGEAQKILDTFRNTDGTINTKLEGADEALTVASTLQSMLDKLTRPAYMDIEVSQVEDELQEPLRNLQELRRLLETEHQLKLTGADTSQLEESKQKVYEYFESLDSDVKIKLGLVDEKGKPLTGQSLKDKLNSGDIAIEATVDIQMKMDDKLGILVDKALLDAGIIDGKEFEKRVDVYLKADVDNEDAKNKTEQAVNEVADGKGGKSSSKDGKSSSDKVDKNVDVSIKADEVDTSDVKNKTEEAVKEESSEKLAVETTVELETTIDEATDLIQKFEDKDITIDVKVKGLDDVKELNQNIDLATKIDGSVNKLSEYVEGAKALSELDDNISSYVTAEIKGNVTDEFEYKLDNLKVFADGAKELQDIGTVRSEVTADIKGNVIDEFEYKLNNLKVLSDSAKNLDDIGDVEANVKANVEGNVTDKFEYKLNNLKVFTDNAKDIGKIGNVESNVKATVNTGEDGDVVDTFEYKLNNLSKFAEGVKSLQGLDDVDISVKATVNTGDDGDVVDEFEYKLDNLGEFASHVKELQGLQSVDVEVKATVNTGDNGDVVDTFEYKLDNLGEFAAHVKELQGLESVNVSVTAEVNTGESGDVVDTFEYKLNNLQTFADGVKALQGVEDVSVTVSAKVNTGSDGDAIDEFEYKLNNLETFAKGVRELQGLENVDVSVNAKVNTGDSGDAVDTFEYKLNNLEVFAKAVRELQGLEDVDLSVKATVNGSESGDVTDTFEYKLDNLGEFAKYVKSLQGLENVDISVKATVSGDVTETAEYKLDNLGEFKKHAAALQGVESKKISITANIYGNVPEYTEGYLDDLQVFAKGAKALQNVASKTVNITANIYGNVPTYSEGYLDDLQVFAKGANALQNTASKTVNIEANANGNAISGKGASGRISRLTEFKSLVNGMSNKTVTVSVTAKVDSENVNKAIQLLKDVSASGVFKNYNATVQVGAKIATIDDTTVKNYQAPKKEGKVAYSVDPASSVYTWTAPNKDGVVNYDAVVEALTNSQKHKTGTITYKAKVTGFPVVNGTANVNGSAFANGTSGKAFRQGDWGVEKTETALTGELGQELVVYGNRFWTVGDNGAEFTTIPKGAIVFNHKQTEEIFKNGRVTSGGGRGKVFANGTAYSSGSGGNTEIVVSTNKNTGKSYTKPSSSSSDSTEKDFEETFDLIEIAISRVERAIDKLDLKASSVYKSWSTRNSALTKEISKVGDEISLQEKAANEYLKAANGVGLSSSWQTKVKNGEVDIETVKDEVLAEKIKDFQDYYEKYLDCIDAAEELRETEAKLFAQRFENVQTQYDGILQGYEHTEAMLNEYISQAEENGYVVSKKYYNALINNEKSNIAELKKEQADLIAKRDEAVDSGAIVKNSEEWLNMCASIDEVTQEIESSTTALLEFDNAMRDIDWSVFDLIQERISAVSEEADFLIELMSNDKLFDDNGKLTSQGLATIGLHAQNYNSHMYAADTYGEEVAKLDKQIESDPYDQELINHRNELLELQREAILNAEQEKDAIRDMVEDGINLELDALQELIDKKNKELESEKDLYEYSKKVKEQTEEIASLEKQMASYSGDDSEEAKTKIQELKVSLEEAKTDLQETEYDKYISDTSALLDELYLEYETILNTRLDNIDYLLESVIETINLAASADGNIATALGSEGALALAISNNATSIGTTLTSEAKNVGTTLSSAMNNIWDAGEGNAKSVLTMYGEDFKTKSTTIITTLNSIKSDIAAMVDDVDKDAQKKVTANKTTTSAKKNPTASSGSSSNKNNSTTNKTTSSGDGRPKVGDKVKFVSGKYYYDSEGKKPLGSKYQGKEVYITKINTAKWATHPYHISTGSKLGKGDLGWLKLNQLSGYASGKKNFSDDEIAWTQEGNKREFIVRPSDGAILTPIAKKDSVLNANASRNIWDMANSPAEFIKENLNLGGTNIPNNSNVNNNYTQHLNVTQNFPNVKSYEETLLTLSKDPNFKRLLNAMTTEQYIGKSSLRIGKAIR